VAIVGAGAAGIAAARKVAAAATAFALIEASDRIGGPLRHHTRIFGVRSTAARIGCTCGHQSLANRRPHRLDLYPAPPARNSGRGRNAREGEMEDYLAALVRRTAPFRKRRAARWSRPA